MREDNISMEEGTLLVRRKTVISMREGNISMEEGTLLVCRKTGEDRGKTQTGLNFILSILLRRKVTSQTLFSLREVRK